MTSRAGIRRLALYAETLGRTAPRQIVTRLARRLRYRWLYPWLGDRLFPNPKALDAGLPADAALLEDELFSEWIGDDLHALADALVARRFAFLNLPAVDLGIPVDWHRAPDSNRLWQYHLHYGEWVLPLLLVARKTGERRYRQTAIELIDDWIAHNPVGTGPGWEPYPITRRLMAWSRIPFLLDADPATTTFWRRRLEPSLRRQARFLTANLEHDVPNNHLLANYRALAWVGLLFEDWPESVNRRRQGLAGLWREMRRQILPDGVHFERSMTYHMTVLEDLLETRDLVVRRGGTLPEDVDPTLGKMMAFLKLTQIPRKAWPMVNDSVPGEPAAPQKLLSSPLCPATPPAKTIAAFPDAGYAVLRAGDVNGEDGGGYLFFDAGPMGPRRIPGHGHADALSIVLYGRSHRARSDEEFLPLIVDPGTDTYESGPDRDQLRGMRVHNTVTIDDRDPCEFWGPFRVAHPPDASLTSWSSSHVEGQHRGYVRFPGKVVHDRRVELRSAGVWEIRDRFTGQGKHRFRLNLQLAPDATADLHEGVAIAVWPEGIRLRIEVASSPPDATAQIATGWMSPGWNQRRRAPRYVLSWTSEVPCETRIVLTVTD